MSKCMSCGESNGFIVYKKVKGKINLNFDSNGNEGDNSNMYNGVQTFDSDTDAECVICEGRYGRVTDLEKELRTVLS